ncbi:MAG: CusA/CzcA family heavy metal efflux RND transporter [Opitutae bacterium]|nr:CusA/CzcA family heavy metal efflux RND transporter [Opitutae bacterium]|tara:strand:- start:4693 stop:7788 length:3096 start_codon:yes stop_codon:yes gene_type:complete
MSFIGRLVGYCVRNPLAVLAGTLALGAWGLFEASRMPAQVLPELTRTTVTIMAEAPGMAPEEVEKFVVLPIENAVRGTSGTQRVRTESIAGLGLIYVEFGWREDPYRARQLVQERLRSVEEDMPEGISARMGPITSLLGEIMLVGLTSSDPERSPMELRTLAESDLVRPLQALPGVAQVLALGGGLAEYRIHALPDKMLAYGVTLEELIEAAGKAQGNDVGGFLENDSSESMLRAIGRSSALRDFENTVVKKVGDRPVLICEVAEVVMTARSMRGDAQIEGRPAVILGVQKQPDADVRAVTRQVEESLQSLSLPSDVSTQILFRQADFVDHAVSNVTVALRDGSVMVAIVLFAFLLRVGTTLIALVAIPLSFVLTFLYLRFTGGSINVMTLGGLAVAAGMVVDDAIVLVENVYRRLRENALLPRPAPSTDVIVKATSEVRGAIVQATIIIVATFAPLFGLGGMEGQLFRPLAEATIVSMLASFLVAITLGPALCRLLLGRAGKAMGTEPWTAAKTSFLARKFLFGPALRWPISTCLVAAFLVLSAFSLFPSMGRSFLPAFNEGSAIVSVTAPPGTSLEASREIGRVAEALIRKTPEVKSVGVRTGRAEDDEHVMPVSVNELEVEFHEEGRSQSEVFAEIRERVGELPGVAVDVGRPIGHRIDHMLSGVEAPIAVKIFGEDLAELQRLAAEAAALLKQTPGLTDVRVASQSLVPQVQILPHPARLRAHGLQVADLNRVARVGFAGVKAGEVMDNLISRDVIVRFHPEARDDLTSLGHALVRTKDSPPVPLASIATVRETLGPGSVSRENGRRRVIVSANVAGRDVSSATEEAESLLNRELDLPEGYSVHFEGQYESRQKATRDMLLMAGVVFLVVVGALGLHFRNGLMVAQALLSVPAALSGGIVAAWWSGQDVSIATLVGLVAVAGISARNVIMLLTRYQSLARDEGMPFGRELILRGTTERVSPILMTALTAAFALVPLALAGGAPGKEILQPMAIVIIGGLVSSTLLSLVLTPAAYWLLGHEGQGSRSS